MANNLEANQKTDWLERDIVKPEHMNNIGKGINTTTNLIPIYASNGSFYENTNYINDTYNLVPVTFVDGSQNVAPTSYFNGMEVVFKSLALNEGNCYVNVNNLGIRQIKTLKNKTLKSGLIPKNWLITLRYDSTQDCFYLLENTGTSGMSYNLFDIVKKDHILTFEESKGLVQLGEYAYKEAVDGSRYGYSDFYNKCVDEYNNSSDESVVYDYNFRTFGNVIIREKNGYITASNFSADNYIYPLNNPSANQTSSGVTLGLESGSTGSGSGGSITIGDDEIFIRFTTGDDITTQQCLWCGRVNLWIGIKSSKMLYYISSNGTTWNIASAKAGSTTLKPNTTYTLVFRHNGGFTAPNNTYVAYLTEGLTKKISDVTLDYSLANATVNAGTVSSYIGISDNTNNINNAPFLGTIYIGKTDGTRLTYRTDVNAKTSNRPDEFEPLKTVTIKRNANGHRFFDIADLSKIDTIYSKTGMAWLYGIDTTNERIRIPRNDWYFMNSNSDNVGDMITEGLPDIYGHIGTIGSGGKVDGAFKITGKAAEISNQGEPDKQVEFRASYSNVIYGNSEHVQTNAIKLIAYMVVGNTEKNISNTEVTDITTSDNDTLPLGSFLISLITPNNPAYLKSTAQFYDGNVYPTFYNYLVNNKSVNPLIKSIDETYTDDCFVIDQANQKFRLPQKVKLSTNSIKTNEDGDLYFKVGNAVQNTEIINVGELTEVVNNKVDINTYNNRNIRYETDWFTVALSQLYTFDISSEKIFELFNKKQYPNVHLIAQVVTATGDFEVGDIIYPENKDYVGNAASKSTDIAICVKNSGILQVRIGNDGYLIVANSNGYTRIPMTSCKYKIIMEGANL